MWEGCETITLVVGSQAAALFCRPACMHSRQVSRVTGQTADRLPPPLSAGKTHAELQALQASIEQQLAEGAAADPEYWEAVLRRLRIHKVGCSCPAPSQDLFSAAGIAALDRAKRICCRGSAC